MTKKLDSYFDESYIAEQLRLQNTPNKKNPPVLYDAFSDEQLQQWAQEEYQAGAGQGLGIFIGERLGATSDSDRNIRSFEGMPFTTIFEEHGPEDWRAGQQSVPQKLANMVPNFVTTLSTAGMDSVWGTIIGGINWAAGGSFVDNPFSNSMLTVQERVREWAPLYQSMAEQDMAWHKRIFGGNRAWANFWGDIIINQAFTAAMVAASAGTAAVIRPLMSRAVGVNALRATRGATAMSATQGAKMLKGLNSGQKTIQQSLVQLKRQANTLQRADWGTQLVSSAHGAVGYARVEALGHARQTLQIMEEFLDQKWNENFSERKGDLIKKFGEKYPEATDAELSYMAEERMRVLRQEEEDRMLDIVGAHTNITFALNLFYLTITNQMMFGRLFSGNYGLRQAANRNLIRPNAGWAEVVRNPARLKEGISSNVLTGPQRHREALKVFIRNPMIQFVEESFLHINRENSGEFFQAQFNEEMTREVDGFWANYFRTFKETFGQIDNWESGMMGFFGGMLGAMGPTVRHGKVTGIGMHGGIWDAIRVASEKGDQVDQDIIDATNNALQNSNIEDLRNFTIRRSVFERQGQVALMDKDEFTFENSQTSSFINDFLLFEHLGMRKEFLEYLESGLKISAEEARAEFAKVERDEQGNELAVIDVFDGMSDSEIDQTLRSTAQDLVEFAKRAMEIYDNVSTLISQHGLPDDLSRPIVYELTFYAASLENMIDRLKRVSTELGPEMLELADKLIEGFDGKSIQQGNTILQQLIREADIASEGSKAKREEYVGLLEQYLNLRKRIQRYGELYDSLIDPESMNEFLTGTLQEHLDRIKEHNQYFLANKTFQERLKELHPSLVQILEATSISDTISDEQGEPTTRTFFGEINLQLARQSRKGAITPTETVNFAIVGINPDGTIALQRITDKEGTDGAARTVSNENISIDGAGNIYGVEGAHRYLDWNVVTDGKQARAMYLSQKIGDHFKTESSQLEAQLNKYKTSLKQAEKARNKLAKAINEIRESTSGKTKKALDVRSKAFKAAMKEALGEQEYKQLNIKAASQITFTAHELQGLLGKLDNSIESLKAMGEHTATRLSDLEHLQADLPLSSTVENTMDRMRDFIAKNSEVLQQYEEAREKAQAALEVLEDTLESVDMNLKDTEHRYHELREALEKAEFEVEALKAQDMYFGEESIEDGNLERARQNMQDFKDQFQAELTANWEKRDKLKQEIDFARLNLDNLDNSISEIKDNLARAAQMVKDLESLQNAYRKALKKPTVTQETTKEDPGKEEAPSVETVTQEEYELLTEEERSVTAPVEKFTNSIYNFMRTTSNYHEYKDNPQFFEPQLRFLEAVTNWVEGNTALTAFTLDQFVEAMQDLLTPEQLQKVKEGTRVKDGKPYSIYFVLTDKQGKPILKKSYYDESKEIPSFAYMSDLWNFQKESYDNVRHSDFKKTDLGNYTDKDFENTAIKFEKDVRDRLLNAKTPVTLQIIGKNPGALIKTNDALPASRVFSAESIRNSKIHIAKGEEITTSKGEIYHTRPGYVYVEVDGKIITPHRETLKEQDIQNIIGALQYALFNKGNSEARRKAYEAINAYTAMYTPARVKKGNYTGMSNFYITAQGDRVVFGDRYISAEKLLAGDSNAILHLTNFLSQKFYEVDSKRLDSGQYTEISDVLIERKGEEITNIELKTRVKTSGYKSFLLSEADGNTPKLTFKMNPKKTGKEAMLEPQFVNPSFRFSFKNETVKRGTPSTNAAVEKAKSTAKQTTDILGKVRKNFLAEAERMMGRDEIPPPTEEDYSPKDRRRKGRRDEIPPPTQEDFIPGDPEVQTNTKEPGDTGQKPKKNFLQAVKEAKARDKTEKTTSSTKSKGKTSLGGEAQKNKKAADKFSDTFDELSPGRTTSTEDRPTPGLNIAQKVSQEKKEEERPSVANHPYFRDPPFFTQASDVTARGPVNLVAEYARFKEMYPDTPVYFAGVKAMMGRDGRLLTKGGYLRVLVNPNTKTPGVLYHEAFHIYSLLVASEAERRAIYDEVIALTQGREIRLDKFTKKEGEKFTDSQAEEYLAEQFRQFMLVGKDNYKFPKNTNTVKTLFDRLWNMVVKFMNRYFKTNINLKEAAGDPQIILDTFNRIAEGKFDLEKMAAAQSVDVSRINGLDQATSTAMVKFLNWSVFEAAFASTKQEPSYTLRNFHEALPKIYDFLKKHFEAESEGLESDHFLKMLVDNWDVVLESHANFLTQYKLNIDPVELLREEGEVRNKNSEAWREANLVNPLEQVQTPLKLLLASLSEMDSDGNRVTVNGYPQSANYTRVVSKLHRDLKNVKDFPHMVAIMESKRDSVPYYNEILNKLNTSSDKVRPDNLTADQLYMQKAFENQFAKAESEYTTLVYDRDGSRYLVSSVSSTVENKMIASWKSNVKNSIGTPGQIFTLVDGRYTTTGQEYIKLAGERMRLREVSTARLAQLQKETGAPNLGVYKEYLSYFGITLDPRVTGFEANSILLAATTLNKELAKRFKKSPPNNKVLAEEIFDGDKFPFQKELKALAGEQAKYEEFVFDNQYRNEDGQWEFSVGLKNSIDKVLDHLNTGQVPDYMTPFDGRRGNLHTYGSEVLKMVRDEGTTIGKVILRAAGRSRGDKVGFNNLKPGDRRLLHAESILNGVFPFLRSAERKIERAFDFGQKFVSFRNGQEFTDKLTDYFAAEVAYALGMKQSPEYGRFKSRAYNEQLNVFRDLAPEGVMSAISEAVIDGPESIFPTVREIMSENDKAIYEALSDYVESARERLKSLYLESRIFDQVYVANETRYRNNGISRQTLERLGIPIPKNKNTDMTVEEGTFNTILDTINYYFTTNAIEQTKLFTGPINTYLKRGGQISELFKRTNTLTSTFGNTTNDPGYNDALNRIHPRADNFLFGEFQHSDRYRDFVVQDVDVSLSDNIYNQYVEYFEKKGLPKESIEALSEYLKQTENDGGGWVTLDGLRTYILKTSGQWGEPQERTWHYQTQLLFQKFLERGKITEDQYREYFKEHLPENLKSFKDRMFFKGEEVNGATLTPFSIKKPISVGNILNSSVVNAGKKQLTKTAIAPLLPSDHYNDPHIIDFMWSTMENGVDFIFPVSSKKGEYLGNIKGELPSLYTEEGLPNSITSLVEQGFVVEQISWDSMADQLDIDPSGHESTTDSTQKRRIIYLDTFNVGDTSDARKDLIKDYNEYAKLYNSLVDRKLAKLVSDFGMTKEGTEYTTQNWDKFVDMVTSEMRKRQHPENAMEAVEAVFKVAQEVNDNIRVFDALPNKIQFINLLQGLVRNRAISLKFPGDMLIQEPVTLHEHTKRDTTKSNPKLLPHRLAEDGKTVLPAQAMVNLPRNFIPLVETLPGVTFEQRLAYFNDVLNGKKDAPFVKALQKIKRMVANRIPGQGLNSVEALEIVQFLNPVGGPRVVLPTEVVTKSGSDFDIDKLTTYLNSFWVDKNNRLVYEEYTTDMDVLWDKYQKRVKDAETGLMILAKHALGDRGGAQNAQEFREFINQNLDQTDIESLLRSTNSGTLNQLFNKITRFEEQPLSEKEFRAKSPEELNSEEAITNRINQLGLKAALHIDNFDSLISPNVTKRIEGIANDLVPGQTATRNHNLMEIATNNKVAEKYTAGAAVLGIEALHVTAHALQQRHPIRVTSPIIRVLDKRFKGKTGFVLGHVKDNDGFRISENNAMKVSLSVDVAKEDDPVISRLNLTLGTSMSQSLLNRLGIKGVGTAPMGIRDIAKLYTSPIVSTFLRRSQTEEAEFLRAQYIDVKKKELALGLLTDKYKYPDFFQPELAKLKPSEVPTFLYEDVMAYIRLSMAPWSEVVGTALHDAKKSAEVRAIDKLVEIEDHPNEHYRNLQTFLYYQEIGKIFNVLQKLTKPDTTLPKDRWEAILQREMLGRLKNSGLFEQTDIESMLNESYIAGFNRVHEESIQLFKNLHIDGISTEFGDFMRDIMGQMFDPTTGRSIEDGATATMRVHNAAVNYILHTTEIGNYALNQRYEELLKGTKDTPSLAQLFSIVKTQLYNRRNEEGLVALYSNAAIQELIPVIKENIKDTFNTREIDYIQKFSRKYTVEEVNNLVEGIRDLMNHPNEALSDLGRGLAELALIQSGVQVSPFSFFDIIPAEEFYARVTGIMKAYMKKGEAVVNTDHAKDEIFANLVNDDLVVPVLTKRDYKLHKKPKQTPYITVGYGVPKSHYDYVKVYNKDAPIIKYDLYKKIDAVEEGYIYTQINVKGQPYRMFEAYAEPRNSIIKTNVRTTETVPALPSQVHPASVTQRSKKHYADKNLKNKYFEDKDTVDAKNILTKIAESDHPLATLARHLEGRINKPLPVHLLNSEVIVVKSNNGEMNDANGVYYPGSHEVYIAEGARVPKGQAEALLLHEIIHGMTAKILDTNTVSARDMKKLYAYALDNVPNVGHYGLTNVKEFVSELFTNSDFIQELTTLPPTTTKGTYANVWEQIVGYIMKLLGIDKQDTLYHQAVNVVSQLVDDQIYMMQELENMSAMRTEDMDYIRPEDMDYNLSPARNRRNRLEVLDDVRAAQIREQKRVEAAEKKRQLETRVPKDSESLTQRTKEELSKVTEVSEQREAAITDVLRNFDTYFPEFKDLTIQEKVEFADSMNFLDIIC